MKKLLLAIIVIATCTMTMAQPRAIGGRIGYDIGVSYQHQIGEKNMIQADVDLIAWGLCGIQGTATYNWLIPLVSVSAGNLNLYPGVGLGAGFEWLGYSPSWYGVASGGGTFMGVAGMIGVEWNFKFPLQLSVEYRPLIGVNLYRIHYHYPEDYHYSPINARFYMHGLWASAAAISVRYKFGGK
jgi:hypothetical protein